MDNVSKWLRRLVVMVSLIALTLGGLSHAMAEEGAIKGQAYPGKTVNAKAYADAATVQWAKIEFDEHLFISQDIHLGGTAGYQRVDFAIPPNWKVLDGSKLEIHMSHSPSLIAALSSLTIRLNGKVIFTTRLDESNIVLSEHMIKIPVDLLKDYNSLELIAYQHYMVECEDPFDPTLWTHVHKDSAIHIHYESAPKPADLADFPSPIFEPRGYMDTTIQYLLPPNPSKETLQSAARIQAALGRWIDWRDIDISVHTSVPEEASGHFILIGTPEENPSIRAFTDLPEENELPLPLKSGVGFMTPGGATVPADHGVLIFTNHPESPNTTLLFVTGNSPAGVVKAAEALALLPYEKSIAGQALVVTKVDTLAKLDERTNPTYIPTEKTFTLADLGKEDVTVRGYYAPRIRYDLNMEPDSHPLAGQQTFKLIYSYGAQLQSKLSSLEVILNGISIASQDLENPEGEQRAELLVSIPAELLAPSNRLEVFFHLYPDGFFICGRTSDKHLWGTVHKESELNMPRDYYTHLPDVSFLRYDWFPYTMYQDLQDTTLVVQDTLTPEDYRAMLLVANHLGTVTHSDGIWLKAFTVSNLPVEVKESDHLVVIDTLPYGGLSKRLISNTDLYYNDKNERVLDILDKEKEMKAWTFKGSGIVEQVVSPFNPDKTILMVRGANKEAIEKALTAVTVQKELVKLEHNLVFVHGEDGAKPVKTTEAKLIGEIPVREEARTWVYLNFWQTALLIVVIILLIYIIVSIIRIVLGRRREARRRVRKRDLRVDN